MHKKAFVLLSGGLDSTTCLYKAMKDFFPSDLIGEGHIDFDEWSKDRKDGREDAPECDWVEAVSIYYGQRHKRELTFAAKTCATFGIKHTILDVGDLLKGKNILLSEDSVGTMDMVHKDYSELKGVSPSYVPFRNGLLLSAITAHAQKYVNIQIEEFTEEMLGTDREALDVQAWTKDDWRQAGTGQAQDLVTIYYGAHAEDAANWAYPDCTPEFNGSMANAIYTGSYNTIRLATPLQWLEKWQIVQLGESLGVNWRDTWSCYDNGEIHCGKCPTCLARKEAFRKAGVVDPTEYAA